jgi:hypothetical protein
VSDLPKLVTFAPMIDSETWRLLLQHYGIAYEEEPHAFLWGSFLALFRAGSLRSGEYLFAPSLSFLRSVGLGDNFKGS